VVLHRLQEAEGIRVCYACCCGWRLKFVVYATVAMDKEASSLYAGYPQAVQCWCRTVKVQADMCWEAAAMIGADII